ncbi:MAG: hypothetical protein AMXMBFR33_45770 [Candidatus Xenobia bacterium]
MPILNFHGSPLYAGSLTPLPENLASSVRSREPEPTFSSETAPSQPPELEPLLGSLARVTLEGLQALGVSGASERPFEITQLWVEGYARGTVRSASSQDAAALVGILVLEGAAPFELHDPQEARRQRLFAKQGPEVLPVPAEAGNFLLVPGWLVIGSGSFDSNSLLVVWTVGEVPNALPQTRPLSLWTLARAADLTVAAPTGSASDAVSLRFRPAVGSRWLSHIQTVVEASDPESGEKHRRESRMTTREEILAHPRGLVKQVEVLESSDASEEEVFQGARLEFLCTPRGEQALIVGQESPVPPSPPVFPESPVRPGDTWTVELESDCTLPGSSRDLEGKRTVRGQGRFDSLEQGLARLRVETTSELMTAGDAGPLVSRGRQSLSLLVEVDTGVCRQSDIEAHEELHLPSGPTIPIVTTTRTETTLE